MKIKYDLVEEYLKSHEKDAKESLKKNDPFKDYNE